MIPNDQHFNKIIEASFTKSPFHQLEGQINPEEAGDSESLYQSFVNLFHSIDAAKAVDVLFIWAVDRPFIHEEGNKLQSAISYIEISKGTIKGRWPKRFLRKITQDCKSKGEATAGAGLQELADRDKNFLFYSKLICEYGPLRIWYTTQSELAVAARPHLLAYQTVRDWERHLLKSYQEVHGARCRPLKNRRD